MAAIGSKWQQRRQQVAAGSASRTRAAAADTGQLRSVGDIDDHTQGRLDSATRYNNRDSISIFLQLSQPKYISLATILYINKLTSPTRE